MPTVEVYVDASDVLDDLSDSELENELDRRRKKAGNRKDDGSQNWCAVGFAEDLRTAFYARNASRFEALLCALDPDQRIASAPAGPIFEMQATD
jgi:hypothetical protein